MELAEDQVRLSGTIIDPRRYVVVYGKLYDRGFKWAWDRRTRTRARITFTEDDLSRIFSPSEGRFIRAAIVKLWKGDVTVAIAACPFCKASARLVQKREDLWTVQCEGFGCGQGFTGNHPTAENARREWDAIVADPAKYIFK